MTIPPEELSLLEGETLENLSGNLRIPGFREGRAPPEIVRAHIGLERLSEEMLRKFIGRFIPSLIKEQNLKPIIPPKVTVLSPSPLTLTILLTEHPDVTVKTGKHLTVEKKESKVEEKDVDRVIQSLLKDHQGKEGTSQELTDAFAKETFGVASVEEFRTKVRQSLHRNEEGVEQRRREQELIEAIRTATSTHLAPELLEHEFRSLEQEFLEGLRDANLTLDEWLRRAQKKWEDIAAEFRNQAERRLFVRFGIERLLIEKTIEVTPEELQRFIDGFVATLPEAEQPKARERFKPGSPAYDDLLWRTNVEKLFTLLLA